MSSAPNGNRLAPDGTKARALETRRGTALKSGPDGADAALSRNTMGCDIHLYVETRTAQGWKSIDAWSREEGEPRDVAHEDRFYTGRNYSLFEMLANVRGAGLLPPISEPKGLPDDVSAEVRGTSDAWGCDGHSHSFLTLRELSGYDWGAATSPEMPWARTRGEAAGDFYIKTMPRLRALSGDGAGDDVRIVFFFDN